jgi:hypothetical protein
MDFTCREELQHPGDILMAPLLAARFPERVHSNLVEKLGDEKRAALEGLPSPEWPPAFADAWIALQAAEEVRRSRREATLATLSEQLHVEPRTTPVDVLAPLIRERLAAPPLSPFTEHPLAQAPAPAAPWQPVEAGTLHSPRDFRPVRIERSGDTVVLLALSQRTDPVGEVSGGAYWLLLSQDGGRTWGEPLYTGLREYRPYELAEQSMLPMLEGDTLRLEASVRELDEKRIRFPPIALPLKRERSGLYLQASLSALRQDSDADGLTDLIEERWLTHPQRADTDADGLRDGEDPLPHVSAASGKPRSEAQLFTTFFAHLKGKATPPPLDADFLALDRDLLSGTRLSSRILVFTPEELEQARGRFGSFYPMELEAFFDADADRALLLWDERWRGGLFLCQKKAGRWVLTSLSSWVT